MPTLAFRFGTIELRGIAPGSPEVAHVPPPLSWDARSGCYRAPARAYVDVVAALRASEIDVTDEARNDEALALDVRVHREARSFQSEALRAWEEARGRGVVVLPTGAGKTHVAVMAIESTRRSTLIVAPTLTLVRQWFDLLRATFGDPIGVVGGGDYDVRPITVTTYDSAYLHMEHLGARFGLVVFDECHHLPGPGYSLAAELCMAPHRLGLTATPERADGRDAELDRLVGPIVYRRDIGELAGSTLAEYDAIRLDVELAPEERARYEEERAIYLAFIAKNGIRFSSPRGFGDFVMRSAQSLEGRRAMRAYKRQREIAFAAEKKLAYVEHLLSRHARDRALLFTEDNAMAYRIARQFLVPVITHQTRAAERSEILDRFKAGIYRAIVTSKVLNEGVDVREANVAIILSGSGSVREHVQRLGRILRRDGDKRAILYELVTARSSEAKTSERRRDHDAYR